MVEYRLLRNDVCIVRAIVSSTKTFRDPMNNKFHLVDQRLWSLIWSLFSMATTILCLRTVGVGGRTSLWTNITGFSKAVGNRHSANKFSAFGIFHYISWTRFVRF